MIHAAILSHKIHEKKNYVGHSNVLLPRIRGRQAIEGTKVVRVYVKKKEPLQSLSAEDIIPSKVIINGEEYETDIVEMDAQALSQTTSFTQKIRPVQPGYSIAHYLVTAGSVGAILYCNGQPLILSNNHVLAFASSAQLKTANVGDAIIQPGCYSEDTRVFTKRGLIYFYEVSDDDEVLTFNLGSGELEWQKPLKIHKYRYTGSMIHFNGQMYNLLVTPNHNMIVRRYGGKWFLVTAEEILQRQFRSTVQEVEHARDLILKGYGRKRLSQKFGKSEGWAQKLIKRVKYELPLMKKGITHATLELPKTGIWKCSDFKEFKIGDCYIPIDEWLQFLGFWLAEGSVYKDKKGGYEILLRNLDFTKLQQMAQILKKWGFSPYISKYGQLVFCSKQLFLWLSGNCFIKPYDSLPKGRKAYYKRVPPAFKELSPERLRILLTWMFKGDGTFEGGLLRRYTTSSKRLAEDVIEMALKCGYAVSISEKGRRLYYVGISNRNITPRITKQPSIVPYDGYVYCLTVSNHTMVVERNGKVSICGNSYDKGVFNTQDAGDCVASLYAFIPIDIQKPNTVDAALASPLTSTIINATYPPPINSPLNGFQTNVNLNDQFQYVGRSSGYKQIKVTDPSANMQINYRTYIATFDDVFVYTPSAIPGDSGSGVLDMNNNLVGLVFAGDTTNNQGLGIKISNILNAFSGLGITLDYKPPPSPPLDINSVALVSHSYLEIGTPTITVEYQGNTLTNAVMSNIYCTLKNSLGQASFVQSASNIPIYPKALNHISAAVFMLINVPAGTYKCNTFVTTTDNVPISQNYEFDVTITKPWFTQDVVPPKASVVMGKD